MGDGIGPEALRLDGQVALVTGAGKNIGAAIAASYARAGADVLLVARGAELLETTAARIRALAPDRRVETATADVGDAAQLEALARRALDTFGRVDTLVNNAFDAGLETGLNILDVPDATWERLFAINVMAPLRLTRALMRSGSVINLVSGSGLLPNSAPGHLPAPTMAPHF